MPKITSSFYNIASIRSAIWPILLWELEITWLQRLLIDQVRTNAYFDNLTLFKDTLRPVIGGQLA
jgi:hypothetical protein